MAPVVPVPSPSRRPPADAVLRIDCDECALQATDACGDCVVTFLCGVESGAPVVVDLEEARAMRLLDEAGLAPPLRHRRRTG
jgi:hypothetical protein